MQLQKQLSQAIYNLARVKGYSLTIILTLGITLGAFIAMFNLNYQILAKPLPYPEADKLMLVRGERFSPQQRVSDNWLPSKGVIEAHQEFTQHIDRIALHNISIDVEHSLPTNPVFNIGAVTPEFFNILDAPMALGRRLNDDETLNANLPVTIISFDVWQTHFNGSNDVLSKSLDFKGVQFRIVGVLAEHFVEPVLAAPGWHTDVWIAYDYNDAPTPSWGFSSNQAHMLVKIDDTNNKARLELALTNWFNEGFANRDVQQENFRDHFLEVNLVPFRNRIIGEAETTSLLMLLGSITLLLIALSNIGNLVISRAVNRQRTMAIHVAMGAQPRDLFKHVFIELFCLFCAAVLLALGVVSIIIEVLKSGAFGPLARLDELSITPVTFMFSLFSALVLNTVLALSVSRLLNYRAINQVLQQSGKGTGTQVSASSRNLFISVQIALCLALLIACIYIFQNSLKILTQPSGLDHQNTYQVALNLGDLLSTPRAERQALMLNLVDSLREEQDIVDVGIGGYPPINYWVEGFNPGEVRTGPDPSDPSFKVTSTVGSTEYLNLLGITLSSGRFFTEQEIHAGDRVMLINQTLASQFETYGPVLGRQIYPPYDTHPHTVIGIVDDLTLPHIAKMGRLYSPMIPSGYPFLIVKTPEGKPMTATTLNQLMGKVHNQIKVYNFATTDEIFAAHTQQDKVASLFTLGLAGLATCLAFIGIYGVLVYNVAVRKTELGIRMSLGAAPATILALVLKDNFKPVLMGAIISLLGIQLTQYLAVNSQYQFNLSLLDYVLPTSAIALLVSVATTLSIAKLIRQPAIYALKDN